MSAMFSFSCYLCFLVVLLLSHSCIISYQKVDNNNNNNVVICMEGERQALLRFKQGLIDKTGRLASWVGDDRNSCRWAGIVCDNITGHVHEIHLESYYPNNWGCDPTRQLGGNLSSSVLHLKQLRHLDISCNDFGGIQVPEFIGSLRNLRYLNLSKSGFNGIVPPQLGNLSRLHVLSVGSFHVPFFENTHMMNMQWLSGLRLLHHLDMSGVDLSKAIDWFQVINNLPSLTELHLSFCYLQGIHPHVLSLNITSLSLLNLSGNDFSSFVPHWIFNITNLVSLDFSWCHFHSLFNGDIDSFRNLTSLKSLYVSGNDFLNSSLVLKGLSRTVGGNLMSLRIGSCGVPSSVLKSFVNICNLKDIDLSFNNFGNSSLSYLLGGFLECESHIGRSSQLQVLDVRNSDISGTIPDFIGQFTSMKRLLLESNWISGPIPHSIGRLSSLEYLDLSDNLLDGNLPHSLGNLSKLENLYFSKNKLDGNLPRSLGNLSRLKKLDFSNNLLDGNLPDSLGNLSNLEDFTFFDNLLTGVITEAHFAKLASLNYLDGRDNNLTLQPLLASWIPPFQLRYLDLRSWSLGPQFPLWLQSQRHLTVLYIRNTGISSAMPVSFWKSFPYLTNLDMSQNRIQGTLLDIPATVHELDLSSNEFKGELPKVSNGSFLEMLDLSSNFFVGSVDRLLCSNSIFRGAINLGNNHLSGVIPAECWDKWQDLIYFNLENNRLSGEIPRTLGSLNQLKSLNMHGNKLSGRIPASLMNLKDLETLQLGRNELVGSIPRWFGNLSHLSLLNLRSNNFDGNIPHELCYATHIQILDLAHNHLSGNIPRCFNNLSLLSGKEDLLYNDISFLYHFGPSISVVYTVFSVSDSLVMKGREDTYNTILGLVTLFDLSSNNLVGQIPSELTALQELKTLNLSRNQLTGMIPEKIGDMKSLETFDVSVNKLLGELPMSLSKLTFLNSFNVSFNHLTGRIPSSTQLQSFKESSFFGNKLCGDPLTYPCIPTTEVPNVEAENEDDVSHGATDWGLIGSIVVGFVVGFWLIVAPLMVSRGWRIAYFHFLSELRYKVYDIMRKYGVNMFDI